MGQRGDTAGCAHRRALVDIGHGGSDHSDGGARRQTLHDPGRGKSDNTVGIDDDHRGKDLTVEWLLMWSAEVPWARHDS